jgi:hypothetical protein
LLAEEIARQRDGAADRVCPHCSQASCLSVLDGVAMADIVFRYSKSGQSHKHWMGEESFSAKDSSAREMSRRRKGSLVNRSPCKLLGHEDERTLIPTVMPSSASGARPAAR